MNAVWSICHHTDQYILACSIQGMLLQWLFAEPARKILLAVLVIQDRGIVAGISQLSAVAHCKQPGKTQVASLPFVPETPLMNFYQANYRSAEQWT